MFSMFPILFIFAVPFIFSNEFVLELLKSRIYVGRRPWTSMSLVCRNCIYFFLGFFVLYEPHNWIYTQTAALILQFSTPSIGSVRENKCSDVFYFAA